MILLVSGGIDSYVAWNYLNKPETLFVDYGQPYINIELDAIKKLYNSTNIVKIVGTPPLDPDSIFIPARNIMLATIGLRYSNTIALGGVKDERCRDKSPKAFRMMSTVLSEFNNNDVTVFSPIWHFTKSESVKDYLNKFDYKPLLDTVSCYSIAICNNCESCFRRFVALASNNIIEQDRLPKHDIISRFIKMINVQPGNRAVDIVCALRNAGYDIGIEFIDNITYVLYSNIRMAIKNSAVAEALRYL